MKTLITAGATLALLLSGGAVALAQETGPGTQACFDARSALAAVPAPVGVPSDLEQKDAQAKEALAALPTTASDGSELVVTEEEIERLEGKLDHPLAQEKIDRIRALLDARAAAETAAQNLAEDQERFAAERQAVTDAEAKRDEACAPPTPETTEPPAEDPAPVDDLDCIDLPLEDGRTAQDVLLEDASDRHNLDVDGDGVACEIEDDSDANDDGVEFLTDDDSAVVVPNGGIATGGGPA